jgi:AcrR family transcriptional regulator
MNSPGLRERKKQKTRWAIQEHALRLIAEQGYEATTVDQIAAAAEISPSTFFRYFKAKEDLIVEDEYDAILESGLKELDPTVPPLDAIRKVMVSALGGMTTEDRRKLLARTKLIRAVPALQARALQNFTATVDLMAAGMAQRTGRPIDSLEVRTFSGAVVGALTAVFTLWLDGESEDAIVNDLAYLPGLIDQVLTFIGTGMPL